MQRHAMRMGAALLLLVLLFVAWQWTGGRGDPLVREAPAQDADPADPAARIARALILSEVVGGQPAETTTLARRMRELRVPGVSVTVFRDGRIEWTRGWGWADAAAQRSVDRQTLFQAASISKPVAAAVVLALVSQGRLSLDADVNGLLRSWKLPANEYTARAPVTLRRLLTHSAGTTVHGFRGYERDEPVPSLVQVLEGVRPANSEPVRVDIPVGSRWRYSGGGFAIVQLVVEDVTQRPFAEAARELVLEPLGMHRSTFVQPLPADLQDEAATGYDASGDPIDGHWHIHPEQAAAGLWTTSEDLATFAIALQRIAAGELKAVMSQALAQEMLRRHVEDSGLGVGLMGDGAATAFVHSGGNEGFRAFWLGYRAHPSGIVVMTNSDAGADVGTDLIRTVAREYGFAGLGPIERPDASAAPKP